MTDEEQRQRAQKPPLGEWIVAGVSTLLVLALLGYLVYLGIAIPDAPAMIAVRQEAVRAMPDGWVVTFAARNSGGQTGRAVQITGTLKQDTATVEQAQATLHFIPTGATRGGGLFFRHDPRRYRLQLKASGYDLP